MSNVSQSSALQILAAFTAEDVRVLDEVILAELESVRTCVGLFKNSPELSSLWGAKLAALEVASARIGRLFEQLEVSYQG